MKTVNFNRLIRWLIFAASVLVYLVPAAFSITPEIADTAPAAQNFHRWGSITIFNGLPSDSVRAIAQTPDGVIWFGTDNGLARFDGRRVQNFLFGDGEANRVLALKTAPSGELWIGTPKGALVYAANSLQPVSGTERSGITAIFIGKEVLLGTDGGLVLRIASDVNGVRSTEELLSSALIDTSGKPQAVTSLTEKDGDLLIGTSGRGVFSVKDGTVTELPGSPRPLFVNSLTADKNGSLWLGTDAKKGLSGIYVNKAGTRVERIVAPTANVLALDADESGIWAGTARYGLFHVVNGSTDAYTFENTSGGLRSNTIFAVFTDREGVVWIGTNRGVSRYDPEGPFQQTVSDIPNRNFIRTFFRSADGNVLFAGSNRGLFEFGAKGWGRVPGLEENVVYSITKNANGPIVGTPAGILDSRGKVISGGDTRAIETFRGRMYVAVFGKGVIDISGGGQASIFGDQTATSLLADADRLWIGTAGNGLYSFDGNSVKTEATPDILKCGSIWRIFENADHSVWLAAEHGVFRYKDGKAEQAIASEDVRDVLVDGADIWAATTTRGLIHARRDERFGWLAAAIGFEQGMPSEKAFAILPTNGRLLIATNRGVVTYTPHSTPPKLIAVRVLSQRLHDLSELSSTISLEYPQNSLLVEVAGQSSRTFPEEFQYAFTLKNGRGDVLDTRLSNDAQYAPSDLKPGEYSIEAIAINRDLVLSDPLIIRFSVAKAPFPLTATALAVLLVLALAGLVWAFIEHRRIVHRNRELAAARLDLANEAERERRRIARDLHDQTLADLRNLMMTSDEIAPGNVKFRTEVEAVSSEIRRICEDLSPSVLENVGLVASLEFLLDRTFGNKKFTADPDLEDRIAFPIDVQLQVYRIAQEILTNIKRHSNAELVEMAIAIDETGEFLLTIRDNGTSFQPDGAVNNGRGITNIKARASMINARAKWQEPKSGGNSFSLRISAENVQGDR